MVSKNKISKNLIRYRFENNFILDYKIITYIKYLYNLSTMSNVAKNFDIPIIIFYIIILMIQENYFQIYLSF